MRGEYKQAEDVCLKVLRRYPNNASANTLLGDICAEKGDLDQAIAWYELALDLNQDSKADQAKLQAVKQRKEDHETATTAKMLGLPSSKSKGVVTAILVIAFIVLVGVVSYVIGGRIVANRVSPRSVVDIPVTIPDTSQPTANNPEDLKSSTTSTVATTTIREDAELLGILSTASPEASRITEARKDPRSKQIDLTIRCSANDNLSALAAHIGVLALDKVTDSNSVLVRAVVDGRVVLVGDVLRENVNKAKTAEWQQTYGNDVEAWVSAVLTNVWRSTTQANPTASE